LPYLGLRNNVDSMTGARVPLASFPHDDLTARLVQVCMHPKIEARSRII
jgi:hypothetical protein